VRDDATRLGVRGTPSFAAGRTGKELRPLAVQRLEADALRPALDTVVAQ
jgi:hypothetical protein